MIARYHNRLNTSLASLGQHCSDFWAWLVAQPQKRNKHKPSRVSPLVKGEPIWGLFLARRVSSLYLGKRRHCLRHFFISYCQNPQTLARQIISLFKQSLLVLAR